MLWIALSLLLGILYPGITTIQIVLGFVPFVALAIWKSSQSAYFDMNNCAHWFIASATPFTIAILLKTNSEIVWLIPLAFLGSIPSILYVIRKRLIW